MWLCFTDSNRHAFEGRREHDERYDVYCGGLEIVEQLFEMRHIPNDRLGDKRKLAGDTIAGENLRARSRDFLSPLKIRSDVNHGQSNHQDHSDQTL